VDWKLKARLAFAIARLPPAIGDPLYYRAQRHFGDLRTITPEARFRAAIDTWDHLVAHGIDPVGRRFCEIGTGRVPSVPLAYWLMGASGTVTLDLHPYLKAELVRECLTFVAEHADHFRELFGARLDAARYTALLEARQPFSLARTFELCGIEYVAPRNAAQTGLPDACVDVHSSYTVLEHIPRAALGTALREALRILRPGGVSIHRIDYSDHFSHSDTSISAVNFLQYTDEEWDAYAGHDYQYVNRLRHDDVRAIFEEARHVPIATIPVVNPRAGALLRSGTFQVSPRFRSKPIEILETTGAWFLSRR
jgi:SAM-dependent methyltransferase